MTSWKAMQLSQGGVYKKKKKKKDKVNRKWANFRQEA